jgi:hypothetical protein
MNEKFRLSDGDRTSPADVGDEVRGCPKCGITQNPSNLEIKDFRWYPIAIDEEYILKNILSGISQTALDRDVLATTSTGVQNLATDGILSNNMSGMREWKTPGNYSFMVPPGVRNLRVLVVGGGGGGGNGIGATNHPPKGGNAGQIVQTILSVTPEQIIALSVGENGHGQTSFGANGTNGGNSSFGTVTATGGNGGFRACNQGQGYLESCGPRAQRGEDAILPNGVPIGKGGPGKDDQSYAREYPNASGNGAGGGSINCGYLCRDRNDPSGEGAPGMVRVEWGF